MTKVIGIDGSRAFLDKRTGIEEYSYQVIKHLTQQLRDCEVVLYVKKNQKSKIKNQNENTDAKEGEIIIPGNWRVRVIRWPRFWTQLGLALEMLLHPVDKLFVPAHTAPWIHPADTTVTVHGLEYEFCQDAYSAWERLYMRWSIKKSCKWAKTIIAVSENTKWDLVQLYNVPENKIEIIHEGYAEQQTTNNKPASTRENDRLSTRGGQQTTEIQKPYLLFVGRVEERKNIANVVKAFDILKDIYKVPHKLVLAGKPGYGYENAKKEIVESKWNNEIVELGYVSEEEKWELLEDADAFVFPTCYEGFGIPVLEAQSIGCPVIAGNNSSIPEIVTREVQGKDVLSAVLVDHRNPKAIAKAMALLINDRSLRSDLVQKGLENVKRFSWSKCAAEIARVLK